MKQYRESERRRSKRFAGYLWTEFLKSLRVFSNIYEPTNFLRQASIFSNSFQNNFKSQLVYCNGISTVPDQFECSSIDVQGRGKVSRVEEQDLFRGSLTKKLCKILVLQRVDFAQS